MLVPLIPVNGAFATKFASHCIVGRRFWSVDVLIVAVIVLSPFDAVSLPYRIDVISIGKEIDAETISPAATSFGESITCAPSGESCVGFAGNCAPSTAFGI